MSTTATAEVSAIESAIRNFDEADNAIMGLPRNRRDPTLVSMLQAWRENRHAVEERLARVRLRAGEDGTDIPREVREEAAGEGDAPTVEQLNAAANELNEAGAALEASKAEHAEDVADLDAQREAHAANVAAFEAAKDEQTKDPESGEGGEGDVMFVEGKGKPVREFVHSPDADDDTETVDPAPAAA